MKKEIKLNKVSVVIPCYNDGEYLSEAVESVEKCEKDSYEIIIVDDGSFDKKTAKVLESLKKRGHKVFRIKHKGQSAARNFGAKKAKYGYLLFLDADNKIHPEYLLEARQILDKNEKIGAVYGDMNLFGSETGVRRQPDFDLHEAFFVNSFDVCAVTRKKLWSDCGGFDEKMDFWEDWEFFMHAKKLGWDFFHIPKILFDYRIKKLSVNSRRLKRENRIRIMNYVFSKHFKFFVDIMEQIMAKYGLKGKINSLRSLLDLEAQKNKELLSLIEEKNCELLEVNKSVIWAAVRKYQKLVDSLASSESPARKFYNKIILFFRKIFRTERQR